MQHIQFAYAVNRYRGVSRKKGKWEAKVMVNRRWAYRELFNTEIEAAKAYDAALKRLKPNEAAAYLNYRAGDDPNGEGTGRLTAPPRAKGTTAGRRRAGSRKPKGKRRRKYDSDIDSSEEEELTDSVDESAPSEVTETSSEDDDTNETPVKTKSAPLRAMHAAPRPPANVPMMSRTMQQGHPQSHVMSSASQAIDTSTAATLQNVMASLNEPMQSDRYAHHGQQANAMHLGPGGFNHVSKPMRLIHVQHMV